MCNDELDIVGLGHFLIDSVANMTANHLMFTKNINLVFFFKTYSINIDNELNTKTDIVSSPL